MGRPSFDDITPPSRSNSGTPVPPKREEEAPESLEATAGEEETEQEDTSLNHEEAHASNAGSIRDIEPLMSKERSNRRARRAERRILGDDLTRKKSSGTYRIALWGGAIAILILVLAGMGFLFIGKTTLTVEPLSERITLGENVVHTAYAEPETGELGFSVVQATREAQSSIAATGSEYVEERASGRIVVYNTYSSASQRLIKNTRFESSDGRIYRVTNSFVVPGMPDEDTPGRIEVTVHADVPGSDQNLTALGTRFTIPGLEGDPRYSAFYAELVSPITGGFEGDRPVVDDDARDSAREALRNDLRTQALEAVKDAAPADIQIFDTAFQIQFDSLPITTDAEGNATVHEQATVYAVGFEKHALARALAETALATPADGNITIANPEQLSFAFVGDDDITIASDALIQFTLSGTSVLIWDIDVDSLKQDLVGKHSNVLNTVMSGYPGIESAQATIRPFWKSEFPSDIDNIEVEITNPQTQ